MDVWMPMRREVWRGGRLGAGRLRMSCSWEMDMDPVRVSSLRRWVLGILSGEVANERFCAGRPRHTESELPPVFGLKGLGFSFLGHQRFGRPISPRGKGILRWTRP